MKKQIFSLLFSLGCLCSFFVVQAAGELQPVQPGRGYLADGTDDYVLYDNFDGSMIGKEVSFQYRYEGVNGSKGVWGATDAEGYRYDVYVSAANKVRIFVKNSGNTNSQYYDYTVPTFVSGEVYNFVVTWSAESTAPTFLLDGVSYTGTIVSTVSLSGTTSKYYLYTIGASLGAASYAGRSRLSNIQVKRSSDGKLLHSWHCDEGSGTTSFDSVREWKGENEVQNPQFSIWTGVLPQNYQINGDPTTTIEKITSGLPVGAGGVAARISGGSNNNDGLSQVTGSGFSLKPNTTYELKAWIKVETGYPTIRIYSGGSGYILNKRYTNTQWELQTEVFNTGGNWSGNQYFWMIRSTISDIFQVIPVSIKELHSPSHGTITNATPATFHTTDTDFESYQNDYGYSENVPSDVELFDVTYPYTSNPSLDGHGLSQVGSSTGFSIVDGALKVEQIATNNSYAAAYWPSSLESTKQYLLNFDIYVPSNARHSNYYVKEVGGDQYIITSKIVENEWVHIEQTIDDVVAFYIQGLRTAAIGDYFLLKNLSLREIPNAKIPLATTETGRVLKEDIFGNDATYTGRTRTEAELVRKNVAVFDGVDDYVDLGIISANTYNNGTIVGRFKKQGSKQYHSLYYYFNGSIQGIQIFISSTNKFSIYTNAITTFNYVVPDDEIIDFVLVMSGTTGYLYVNGVLVDTQTGISFINVPTAGQSGIGRWDSSNYFKGTIQDLKIYDYAFSSLEALQYHNGFDVASPIHSWTFSEGAGTTVYDTVPTWYGDNKSLLENLNFSSGWATSSTTIINSNTYSYAGDNNGVYRYNLVTVGNKYKYVIRGHISGDVDYLYLGNPNNFTRYSEEVSGTGDFTIAGEFEADGTGLYLRGYSNGGTVTVRINSFIIQEVHDPINGTVITADLDTFWATDMDAEDQNLMNGYTPVALLNGIDDRTLITNGTTLGGERLVAKLKTTGTERQAVFSGAFDTTEIVHFDTSGKFGSGGANVTGVATTESFNDGEWHIFDITKNATNDYTILVDGEDYSGGASSGYRVTNAVGLAYSSPLLPFNGEIQYITVYDSGGSKLIDLRASRDGQFRDAVSGNFYTSDGVGYKDVSLPAQHGSTGLDINNSRLVRSPQDLRNSAMAYKNVGVFDGVDDYVDIDDPDDEFSFIDQMTISAWINPSIDYTSALSQYVAIINRQHTDATVNSWILAINPNGKLHLGSNGGNIQSTQNSWTADTWYHVVATYNATGLTGDLYINGVRETLSVDNYDIMGVIPNSLWIGGSSSLDNFNGEISDVRIYNRVLSATDIEKLYQGESISTNGLVAHYPLTEGAGTTVYDAAPEYYGENLVLNGQFNGESGWTLVSPTNITGGVLNISSTGISAPASQSGIIENGKSYRLEYDVIRYGSGGLQLYYGSTYKEIPSTIGHHLEVFTATGTIFNLNRYNAYPSTDIDIDNVSLQQIHEPIPGTLTNTTSTDFWQIDDTAPFSQSYREGFSQGLVNTTAGTAYTPSDVAYGEWEFDIKKEGDGNIYFIGFLNSDETFSGTNNGYNIAIDANENLRLQRSTSGSRTNLFYTANAYISLDTWYRIKITRSDAGLFTMYIKGGEFGDEYVLVDTTGGSGSNPVTDATYATSSYFVTDLDAGDQIANVQIDGHRASVHEFELGTGKYDKLFIPSQSGRGMDVLGSVLQISGTKTATFFTAADLTIIAAQRLARAGIHYWDATTKKFFTGRADGSLSDFVPNTERMKTSAELATINTNQTADADHNYWDTTLRKFFRGLSDGTLVDFLTWYAGQ